MVEIGDFEFYGDEGAEDRVRGLIEQRDELLEALQDCREALRRAGAEGELRVVDAAISRALGENKE